MLLLGFRPRLALAGDKLAPELQGEDLVRSLLYQPTGRRQTLNELRGSRNSSERLGKGLPAQLTT